MNAYAANNRLEIKTYIGCCRFMQNFVNNACDVELYNIFIFRSILLKMHYTG